MNIQKRNDSSTISEVVFRNLNMTKEEFNNMQNKTYHVKNLKDAAIMIRDAVMNYRDIRCIGDYDVDGVMSCSIFDLSLRSLGYIPTIRIPRRFSEGYGLNKKIIDEITSNDVLIVTIDNGIAAHEAIQLAKEKGYDVIIIDHHELPEDAPLPNADIIVDPHVLKDDGDFKDYCGAGLAYKLAIEMGVDEKTLKICLGLAAIATIADVVSLKYDNWNIVRKGLKTLTTTSGRTIGLSALLNACNLSSHLTEHDVGFKIGPIINAAGRLLDNGAELPYDLIVNSTDMETATKKVKKLFELNDKRKELTYHFSQKIIEKIGSEKIFTPLVLFEQDMPEGIIGIVSGKISEKYKVPCFLMTQIESGDYKGSARSYGDFNIKAIMDINADIFLKYGGHKAAAGFTIPATNFEKMVEIFSTYREFNLTEEPTYYDLEISSSQIQASFEELKKYAPYGVGNPRPLFLIKNFCTYPFGGNNFIYLSEGKTIKLYSKDITAIGFQMAELFKKLDKPNELNMIAYISENNYQKLSIQLVIKDMEKAIRQKKKSALELKLEEIAKQRELKK